MKSPRTIKGFLSALLYVAHTDLESFRGWDDLTKAQKQVLIDARAEAYNYIGEVKEEMAFKSTCE